MLEISMSQFFKDLKKIQDEASISVMQFRLELAQAILHKAQDNVRDNFGRGRGASKSKITERNYGNRAKNSGRTGTLRNSGQITYSKSEVVVSFGGLAAPYARIQEEGGVITPRNSKYLTIPFGPKYAGTRAGEHYLKFAMDAIQGPVLVVGYASPAKYGAKGQGKYEDDDIAFLLRKKVTLQPRPYLGPAVEEVSTNDFFRDRMKAYFNGKKLAVEIS